MPRKEKDAPHESTVTGASEDPWFIALARRIRVETMDEFLNALLMRDSPPSRLFRPHPRGGFLRFWQNRVALAIQLGLIYGNAPPENPRRYGPDPALAWVPRQGRISPVDASLTPEPL